MHELIHLLGLDNANSVPYLFYSGIGGDLAELFSVVGLLVWLHRHPIKLHVHHKHND